MQLASATHQRTSESESLPNLSVTRHNQPINNQ